MASKTVTRSITSTKNMIVVKVGEGYNGKTVIIQRLLFVLDRDKTGKLERPLELWLRYLAKKVKNIYVTPYTAVKIFANGAYIHHSIVINRYYHSPAPQCEQKFADSTNKLPQTEQYMLIFKNGGKKPSICPESFCGQF